MTPCSLAVVLQMRRRLFVVQAVALVSICLHSASCASETLELSNGDPTSPAPPNSPGDSSSPRDPTSPGDPTTPPPSDQVLPTLAATRLVVDDAFATAPLCANCHANVQGSAAMRDESSRPIGPFDLWRSSMMANAARDPLWRAMMSAEIAATPSRKAEIEAKCFSCHGPMAKRAGLKDGALPTLEMVYTDTDRSQILLDGVSCTVCHQSTEEHFGEESGYSGNFVVNDYREIYGPHANPFGMPMSRMSGYDPVYGDHVLESALCGTCHTLFTNTLDPDGTATGDRFAEQTPYLEWRNSVYNDEVTNLSPDAASCQDCHQPKTSVDGVEIRTEIARMGGMHGGMGGGMFPARSPYGRHVFVGANTFVPTLIRDNAAELQPNASAAALNATIAAAREELQERTATMELVEASRVGDRVRLTLRLENLAGHKLPTGFPSRRAWVRLEVIDDTGEVPFASGVTDDKGRLLNLDGEVLASEAAGGPIQAHRNLISSDEEVLIFEDIMGDVNGNATFTLLRAAVHLKDNRLLPKGWNPNHPDAEHTGVYGAASQDGNFVDGADTVTYEVRAPVENGPYRVRAAFLYQTLNPRFAAELFSFDTAEVETLERYYAASGSPPETMAELEYVLE